jgi:hypothetical protein
MLTFCVEPDIVIVEVLFVKMLPAPEVFHVPETVNEPEDIVIVPLVPPVIVTFPLIVVVPVPIVRMALLATLRPPDVNVRLFVASVRVVVPDELPVC